MKPNIPDQSEVMARIDVLTLKSRSLSASLAEKNGQKVTFPVLSEDCLLNLQLLERHVLTLESMLTFQPSQSCASAGVPVVPSASVPARQAGAAGKSSQVETKPAGTETKKLTATEEVLARKGVKTLAELEAIGGKQYDTARKNINAAK